MGIALRVDSSITALIRERKERNSKIQNLYGRCGATAGLPAFIPSLFFFPPLPYLPSLSYVYSLLPSHDQATTLVRSKPWWLPPLSQTTLSAPASLTSPLSSSYH
jgi:hypothetical protein